MKPELISLGPFVIRWYGLLFAISFMVGHRWTHFVYESEGKPSERIDRLLIFMVFGTVIGARLGHCLLYEPDIYLADPIRILKVWEGGLASHGAAAGILIAIFVYTKKYREFRYLQMLDRLCPPVATAGGLIRLGNLFNSEIVGHVTDVPWAFVFTSVDAKPRHPTQLYESISYFVISYVLYRLYLKPGNKERPGLIFGTFLTCVFTMRFVIEFFKENQVAFESSLPLNMGQMLSIPLVALGAFLVYRAWKSSAVPASSSGAGGDRSSKAASSKR